MAFLVLPQIAVAGRHLDRAPEEYLKEALAVEVLLSWSRACPGAGVWRGAAPWDARGVRSLVEELAKSLLHSTTPAVLVVGGVHLKALVLLINGSEELPPSVLERAILNSISSLVSAGAPYHLVDEALSSPSTSSLLKLLAYSTRVPGVGRCLEGLAPKIVSFCVYVERGDIERARALAEEVLNAGSALFGIVMASVLDGAPRYGRWTPALEDLPEEFAEKLVAVLREHNISIGEVLARYSIAELAELYEKLIGAAGAGLVLGSETSSASGPGQLGGLPPGAGVDEDVLRPAIVGSQGASAGDPVTGTGSGGALSELQVRELLSRIPSRVLASAISIVRSASFREQLDMGVEPRREVQRASPVGRERAPELVLALAAVAVAASVGGLYHLALRSSRAGSLPQIVGRELGVEASSTADLGPAVRLFWRVVSRLASAVDVKILPSDTHREIVEKLGSRVDDLTSAGLRRLGKLYETARYSREKLGGVVERELESLRRFLGE